MARYAFGRTWAYVVVGCVLGLTSCGLYDALFHAAEDTRLAAKAGRESAEAARDFLVGDAIPWAVIILGAIGTSAVEWQRRKWKRKANGK